MFPAILLLVVMLNQIYAPLSLLPGGLEPDMALLAVVAAGRVYTPWGAAALGFAAGLLQETLTGGLLGVGALSKGLSRITVDSFVEPCCQRCPCVATAPAGRIDGL